MKPRIVPPKQTARTLHPLRIFSVAPEAGIDPKYDRDFIQSVARNWRERQAKGEPGLPQPVAYELPAADIGIGHEEHQQMARMFAERSDLPSCGYPSRVWVDGDHLMAELEGIPFALAQQINAGHYSTVSSEFYDDYRMPTGKTIGPVLRRVSILGGEIPKVKNLGRLPVMVFSENTKHGQYTICFSETKYMDRNAIIQALADMGMDTSTIDDTVQTPFLQAVLSSMQNMQGTSVNASHEEDPMAMDMSNMNDDEKSKFDQTVQAYAERAIAKVINPLKKQLAQASSRIVASNKDHERQAISAFCEKNAARIFPYELDPKVGPTIVDQLLAMSSEKVLKFGEKGDSISPREAMMKAIEARPVVVKFGERMAQPMQGEGQADDARAKAIMAGSSLQYLTATKQ
jgi:hypothetical protein